MQNGMRAHLAASLMVDDCRALPKRMRPVTREIRNLATKAPAQRTGAATALMHQVCAEADEAGITLVLWPKPFGYIALSQAQLIAWYGRRFGFMRLPGDGLPMLARSPGATPRYLTPIAAACHA